MRIGILGGTFDPPHVGHLELARAAMQELSLDEVIFLPAHRNPMKGVPTSPAKQRLAMVQEMISGETGMSVSDIEISRGGPSYMVETLMELQMVKPGDYWLLLGADALLTFPRWKNPEKILKLCRLGVGIRPPMLEADAMTKFGTEGKERIDVIGIKLPEISSTDIRNRLSGRHGTVAPFLSPSVLSYIKQNHLYGK